MQIPPCDGAEVRERLRIPNTFANAQINEENGSGYLNYLLAPMGITGGVSSSFWGNLITSGYRAMY